MGGDKKQRWGLVKEIGHWGHSLESYVALPRAPALSPSTKMLCVTGGTEKIGQVIPAETSETVCQNKAVLC